MQQSNSSRSPMVLGEVLTVLREHGLIERVQRVDVTETRTSVELKPLRQDAAGRELDARSIEPERPEGLRKYLPGAALPDGVR